MQAPEINVRFLLLSHLRQPLTASSVSQLSNSVVELEN